MAFFVLEIPLINCA